MRLARKVQTADNNGNHDARLLYILVLGSSRAHYPTPRKDARDDVIAVDVICHLPELIKKGRGYATL